MKRSEMRATGKILPRCCHPGRPRHQGRCKSRLPIIDNAAPALGYGCVPRALSADDAGEQLLDWLKGPARSNPKYEKMSLDDVLWEGVDALWPCKAK
jgi:hypothetical protein